ncbi:MAG: DNA-processing protein DprA [Chitinophagaceae bacterium]
MDQHDELFFSIALTLVPKIGPVQSRILLEHLGSAKNIFNSSPHILENIPGIGQIRAQSIRSFRNFPIAEKEIEFIIKYHVKPLLWNDADYPARLKHCEDAPVVLFFKGNANLNHSKILGIVGTRRPSDRASDILKKWLSQLTHSNVIIVSGLAYGIDAIAHRNSLEQKLHTVGVLANGLDRIYPHVHRQMAKEMVHQGGLITEFISGSDPDRQNFPKRNRIVAGLCDGILVVESGEGGGSIITADLAQGYNREVMAIPGRINDLKSKGCNSLIKTNRAHLVDSVQDIFQCLNWDVEFEIPVQKEIIFSWSNQEQALMDCLAKTEKMHIDRLFLESGLKRNEFASALLRLEMEDVIQETPGKYYHLKGS